LVAPWGDVTVLEPEGPRDPLRWYVAAEDRWHVPPDEVAVRSRRIDGTPVVETRLRIPDGDAVERVWSVPDAGGLTVVEFENDSPLPIAVALAGARVLTERAPADVPIDGIDLPDDAIVWPIGHRAVIRVAIAHDPARRPRRLPALAPVDAVVNGWRTVVGRASRLELPDEGLVEAVTAARCDLLLGGPTDAVADPVGFLLDVAELGRLGDDAEAWMPEIVEPVAEIARRPAAEVDAVLVACERLAVRAGDERAARDLERLRVRRRRDRRAVEAEQGSFSDVERGPSAGRFVAAVEQRLVDDGRVLPVGIPRAWFGSNFEVHGIPSGPRSALSFAVRWHSERPAVLWEQQGAVRTLSAPRLDPAWSSDAGAGEALWPAPPRPSRIGLTVESGES
jgi:hypothetical protein